MSRGNQPDEIPVTANGAAARDDISDVGLQPPSDRTLAAGAQAAEAMRQAASSSSAAAVPTPTAVTVDQNVLVDTILQRLQQMGVTGPRPQQSPSTEPPNPPAAATAAAPPASNTEPEAESWRESGWIDHEWNESQWNPGQTDRSQQRDPGLASGSQSGDRWTTWQDNRSTDWNQGRWEKSNWKDEDREDRYRP